MLGPLERGAPLVERELVGDPLAQIERGQLLQLGLDVVLARGVGPAVEPEPAHADVAMHELLDRELGPAAAHAAIDDQLAARVEDRREQLAGRSAAAIEADARAREPELGDPARDLGLAHEHVVGPEPPQIGDRLARADQGDAVQVLPASQRGQVATHRPRARRVHEPLAWAERLEQHARAQALDSERRDVAAGPALGDHHRELGRHRQPLAPGPAADRQEHARAELGPLDPLAARDHPTDPLRARPLGGQRIATSDLQAIHRRDRADQDLDQQLARARLGLWQLDELEHLERMARVVDVDGPQEG